MTCTEWSQEFRRALKHGLDYAVTKVNIDKRLSEHRTECSQCEAVYQAALLLSEPGRLKVKAPPELAKSIVRTLAETRTTQNTRFVRKPVPVGSGSIRRSVRGLRPVWHWLAPIAAVLAVMAGSGYVLYQGSARSTAPAAVTEAESRFHEDIVSSDAPDQDLVTARFSIIAPEAEYVSVVGDWNLWNPETDRMKRRNETGVWEIDIAVPRDNEYRYQFVIDKTQWIPDPNAQLTVDDGFGGANSILDT